MPDVLVIGGGVLGLSAAYHLVREGASVTLVDRADAGQATAAGAGILSAETDARDSGPRSDLARRAFHYYPALVKTLEADGEGETGYARCPLLLVAADERDERSFEDAWRVLAARQARGETPPPEELHEVTPAEARRMFPPLAPVRRAVLHRSAGRVDGRLLAGALRRAAARRGLIVRRGGAARLTAQGGRVTGAEVDGAMLGAGGVVVAAGAWSAGLLAPFSVALPVAPQRGQIVHLRVRGQPTDAWAIVTGFRGHYIVPWPDGRVAAGATRESGAGFDPRVTAAGVREVLSEALRAAPGLAAAEIAEIRVGLRPLSDDGVPVLGPVPGLQNLYLATGHGPSGLQLGPLSGKLVADAARGRRPEVDLEPFGVERFARAAQR